MVVRLGALEFVESLCVPLRGACPLGRDGLEGIDCDSKTGSPVTNIQNGSRIT